MGMVAIQPYILGSKLKKTKREFQRFIGYLNSINPIRARFRANSSSCMTTEFSKSASCPTDIENMLKVSERSSKNLVWYIKYSGEVIDKLGVESSMQPVGLHMIFQSPTLLYL